MRSTVSIPGIHCESCAELIKDISSDFPEITNIAVDLGTKRVTFDHAETFNMESWKHEIEKLGKTYAIASVY